MTKKKNNIIKNISNKRVLLLASALLIAVVLIYVATSGKTKPSVDITPTITSTPTPTSAPVGDVTDTKPDQVTPTTQPSARSINIIVSALGQDTNGGPLLVRTILEGATGTGTCTIKATSGSMAKTYTTDIVFSGTYYSCNYSIPFADLSAGQWNVSINATQVGKSGEINNTVSIKS